MVDKRAPDKTAVKKAARRKAAAKESGTSAVGKKANTDCSGETDIDPPLSNVARVRAKAVADHQTARQLRERVQELTAGEKADLVQQMRATLHARMHEPNRKLGYADVAKRFNVSVNTIRNWCDGRGPIPFPFPKPRPLWPGSKRVGWPEKQIDMLELRLDIMTYDLDPALFSDYLPEFAKGELTRESTDTPLDIRETRDEQLEEAPHSEAGAHLSIAPSSTAACDFHESANLAREASSVTENSPFGENPATLNLENVSPPPSSNGFELVTPEFSASDSAQGFIPRGTSCTELSTAPQTFMVEQRPSFVEFPTAPTFVSISPRDRLVGSGWGCQTALHEPKGDESAPASDGELGISA